MLGYIIPITYLYYVLKEIHYEHFTIILPFYFRTT
jgi:hypothetical protein